MYINKRKIALVYLASSGLAILVAVTNFGTLMWPGLIGATAITLLFPRKGPLEHPTFIYLTAIPLNALAYMLIVMLGIGVYRFAKKLF